MRIISICLNAAIVVIMVLCLRTLLKKEPSSKHFRYFTTDSNILCAVSALFVLCAELFSEGGDKAITVFKLMGTVGVALTMFTVLFFLAPTQGWKKMFEGTNLYLHLINPLLAIVSFLLFDKGGSVSMAQSLLGLLPMALYGAVYIYCVLIKRKWEDFYGFNRGGHWYISVGAMFVATLLICIAIKLLKAG